MWERRCYKNGIPDEVPALLAKTNRAPSYKAIAICILKNDLLLRGIGFNDDETELIKRLRANLKNKTA